MGQNKQAQLPADGEMKNQLLAVSLELNLQIVVSFCTTKCKKKRPENKKLKYFSPSFFYWYTTQLVKRSKKTPENYGIILLII